MCPEWKFGIAVELTLTKEGKNEWKKSVTLFIEPVSVFINMLVVTLRCLSWKTSYWNGPFHSALLSIIFWVLFSLLHIWYTLRSYRILPFEQCNTVWPGVGLPTLNLLMLFRLLFLPLRQRQRHFFYLCHFPQISSICALNLERERGANFHGSSNKHYRKWINF